MLFNLEIFWNVLLAVLFVDVINILLLSILENMKHRHQMETLNGLESNLNIMNDAFEEMNDEEK